MLVYEDLTETVIGAAIEVHRALGPGLLESAYEGCLCYELGTRGLRCARQVPFPIAYKEVHLDGGYRIDVVVEDAILVELKAAEALLPIHDVQLLTTSDSVERASVCGSISTALFSEMVSGDVCCDISQHLI